MTSVHGTRRLSVHFRWLKVIINISSYKPCDLLHEIEPIPDIAIGFKTLRIGHAWPKRKPSTFILLKDHNDNSKTLINILLSPSISALLNSQISSETVMSAVIGN